MPRSERLRARREARAPRFTVGDGARIGGGVVLVGFAVFGFVALCVALLGGGLLSVL